MTTPISLVFVNRRPARVALPQRSFLRVFAMHLSRLCFSAVVVVVDGLVDVVPKRCFFQSPTKAQKIGVILSGHLIQSGTQTTKKKQKKQALLCSYLSDLLRPSGQIEAFSPLPGLVVFHRRRRPNDLVVINFRLRHRDRVVVVLASSSPMSQKRTRRR